MQNAHLLQCRKQIEESLGWGPSESWDTQDFEELSDRLLEKTGQVISATTLKRIWGRVAYQSKPSRHSLDTLAIFLGHQSWRGYTASLDPHPAAPETSRALSIDNNSKLQPASKLVLSIFMLLMGASVIIWLGMRNAGMIESEATEPNRNIKFASRPVADDLPNTVIFEYDVTGVEGDSFFIQQSWDSRRRTRISADNTVHSSIYFYPGFYNAKLIANDSVIKELPVHVKTSDWSVMLQEEVPVYLPKAARLNDGSLSVSKDWLLNEGYNIDSGDHRLAYYYVQDFGPLHTDNFSLEAVIRHIKPNTSRPCQGAQLTIRGEDGMISFPFDIPGCAGVMHVFAGETHHPGDSHDLSMLGADFSNWQAVSLRVREKNVQIQIGTNPPYSLSFEREMGKVVGLWFQFMGRGALDEVRLLDGNDRVIYEELF